ncbi:hypothetical protein JCM8115_005963 [Rhodotorula mucilaginosa]|nr:hypothetical protein B0A53_00052 [Rhodotorula sp. CCFEE 5036]
MPAPPVARPLVLPRDVMCEIALHVSEPDKDGQADDYSESPVQLASLALVNKAWYAVCSPLIWKHIKIRARTIATRAESWAGVGDVFRTSQTTSLLLDLRGLTSLTAGTVKVAAGKVTGHLQRLCVELSSEYDFDPESARSIIKDLSLGFVKHLSLKLSLAIVAHLHVATTILNACPRLTSVRLARVHNFDSDGDGDGEDLPEHERPACILLYELLRNKLKVTSLHTEFPLPCTLVDVPCPWQLTSLSLVTHSVTNADTLKEVLLHNSNSLVHLNLDCHDPLTEMASSSRRLFAFPRLEALTLSEPTFLACLTNKTSLSRLIVTVKPSSAPELLTFLERQHKPCL